MRLAEALRAERAASRTIVVAYVMVDRRRTRRLPALALALREGGVTALEMGFPFSDPIADGPVLEAAAGRSLAHGTHWRDLLESCRATSPILPTAVMTYANPVWQEGLDAGLRQLASAGCSGLIVPDLPLGEATPWRHASRRAGLSLVMLAAPGSPRTRVQALAKASEGFLYLVSRYGTTGSGRRDPTVNLRPIVDAAHEASPQLPVLVGFGVRDAASSARALSTGADGVVVGTALEELLAAGPSPRRLTSWFRSIANAGPHPPGSQR